MPLSTRVPPIRTQPFDDAIKVGLPPRGPFWGDLARLSNYVRGRGVCLVPSHAPMVTITSGANDVLRYRARGSGLAIARVWVFQVHAISGFANITAAVGAVSHARTIDALESLESGRVVLLETGVSKSSGIVDISATITNVSGTGSVLVTEAQVWELPRAALSKDSTDLGADVDTVFASRPILQRDNESVYGPARGIHGASGRRGGLAAWWGPVATFNSGSAQTLFTAPVRVTPGVIAAGDTTTPVEWDIYARVTNGTTKFAVVIRDAASGVSSAIDVDGAAGHTSFLWLGTDTSKSLLAEDLTEPSGLQSGAFDTVQLEATRTGGAGNLELRGWCLREAPW